MKWMVEMEFLIVAIMVDNISCIVFWIAFHLMDVFLYAGASNLAGSVFLFNCNVCQ